jgi:hypothetical protein
MIVGIEISSAAIRSRHVVSFADDGIVMYCRSRFAASYISLLYRSLTWKWQRLRTCLTSKCVRVQRRKRLSLICGVLRLVTRKGTVVKSFQD